MSFSEYYIKERNLWIQSQSIGFRYYTKELPYINVI